MNYKGSCHCGKVKFEVEPEIESLEIKRYSLSEERISVVSHALGLGLSVVAFVLLIRHATLYGNILHIVSFGIFGASLIALYAASTIYHSVKQPKLKSRWRIIDHASIYVLIAGTYTPFTLIALNGLIGWVIFGISWGMALSGIIIKLFFTGKYRLASTLMYVFMGWIIVFAIKPLINNLSADGLCWLLLGGLAYTIGAILYGIKKIKFNHAIFHIFVLIGGASHFISVYYYLLPSD